MDILNEYFAELYSRDIFTGLHLQNIERALEVQFSGKEIDSTTQLALLFLLESLLVEYFHQFHREFLLARMSHTAPFKKSNISFDGNSNPSNPDSIPF
jgi:hypothetical protein